jgi:hypothetical protein
MKNSKYYKVLSWTIKLVILINLIVGTSFIVYFTDFVNPFNMTFSLYYDFLKPYIEFLKQLWNKLVNFNIEDSLISNVTDTNNIKNQVKSGIKEGVKEALEDVLADLSEENSSAKTEFLKQLAVFSGVLFLGYFIFILPGPSISPEELTNYNWLNQGLIEFKGYLINLFNNKPGNPGNGTEEVIVKSPIQISPTLSNGSSSSGGSINSTDTIRPEKNQFELNLKGFLKK